MISVACIFFAAFCFADLIRFLYLANSTNKDHFFLKMRNLLFFLSDTLKIMLVFEKCFCCSFKNMCFDMSRLVELACTQISRLSAKKLA